MGRPLEWKTDMCPHPERARPSRALLRLLSASAVTVGLLATVVPAAAQTAPGLRIFKDPTTGQLRAPTAEEVKALEQQEQAARAAAQRNLRAAPARPNVPVMRPDGSRMLALDESSMSYSVMTRRADGTLELNCVQGEKAALKIVKGQARPVALKTKEHAHGTH